MLRARIPKYRQVTNFIDPSLGHSDFSAVFQVVRDRCRVTDRPEACLLFVLPTSRRLAEIAASL
jgi:hypothetical protein